MPSPREQPNPRGRRRQDAMPGGWLWIVVLLLLAVVMWITVGGSSNSTLDYSDFLKLVRADKVVKVLFKEGAHSLTGEIDPAAKIDDLPVSENARTQLTRSRKFE